MIEKKVIRDGREVIEVRSEGGKLLYVKTADGYEMKCPRTKQICLVRYDQMLFDCLQCLSGISDEELLLDRTRKLKDLLAAQAQD